MAVNEQNIAEFEDMFNLSSKKSDDENEQAEEYSHSTESTEPFENLVTEVSDDIEKSKDQGASIVDVKAFDHALTDEEASATNKEDVIDIVKDVCSGGVDSISSPEVEEKVSSVDDFFDEFDSVTVVSREVVSEESVKEVKCTDLNIPHDNISTYGEVVLVMIRLIGCSTAHLRCIIASMPKRKNCFLGIWLVVR